MEARSSYLEIHNMWRAGIATLALAGMLPTGLHSQRLRVAVAVSDSAARGVFQGGFVSALRSLGDVEVVSLSEEPEYVLSGVVICSPIGCSDPDSYSASLRLYSPADRGTAYVIAARLLPRTSTVGRQALLDSLTDHVVYPMIRGMESTHQEWVLRWGRQRYEQAIREMVREIDVGCFEKSRAIRRAVAESNQERSAAIMREVDAKRWSC